jgi:sortase A
LISVWGFQLWQAAAVEHQAAAAQQRAAAVWASAGDTPSVDGDEAAPSATADAGAAIARLTVPALGVDLYVLPDADWDSLADGPGLFAGVLPGAPGESVLAGHRETHFAFLRDLSVGDVIVTEDRDGLTTRFTVTDARVVDGRTVRAGGAAAPDDPAALMLVTCYPFDADEIGPERYVVVAEADI